MIEEEIEEIMDEEDEKSYDGAVLPYTQFEEVLLNFFRDASICRAINEFNDYFFDIQCELYPASAVCVITKIGLFQDGCGSYLSEDHELPAFERAHFRDGNGVTFSAAPFRYDANVVKDYASDGVVHDYAIASYICGEILFTSDLLGRDGLFECVPGSVRYIRRKRVIHVQNL